MRGAFGRRAVAFLVAVARLEVRGTPPGPVRSGGRRTCRRCHRSGCRTVRRARGPARPPAAAIEQAQAAAGGKDVLIAGGLSIAEQAIATGLVDEICLHIAPVLLGSIR